MNILVSEKCSSLDDMIILFHYEYSKGVINDIQNSI